MQFARLYHNLEENILKEIRDRREAAHSPKAEENGFEYPYTSEIVHNCVDVYTEPGSMNQESSNLTP